MVRSLHSFYADPEQVLALQPAEIGQVILQKLLDSKDVKRFHRNNFTSDAIRDYPSTYHESISNALMEGLTWLEGQQSIAQSSEANGWYFVTRHGEVQKQIPDEPLQSTEQPTDERSAEQGVSPVASADGLQRRDEIIFRSGISDQAANKDALGFGPYVTAIANFLIDEKTEPPLTLSIEGEWGTGKSSFMLQLRALLEKRGDLTVGFNAWRHDKADELWAAFALEFLDQISKTQPFWRRWWANINLRRSRYDWAAGSLDFLRAFAAWVLLVVAGAVVPALLFFKGLSWTSETAHSIVQVIGESGDVWTGFVNWLLKSGGGAAILFIAATLWLKLKSFIGNPITTDLKRHLKSPNYEERVAFVERFHRDLQKVVKCYVGKRKVYVFIDDLDRCEVPKAADLMQAINLMIANDPHLFFIVGMDRQKIAAGLAVKYEKLLPYIAAPQSSATNQQAISNGKNQSVNIDLRPLSGLDFGYQFIEKFVQLPFRLPVPSESDLERLLSSFESEREPTINSTKRFTAKARFNNSQANLEGTAHDHLEQRRPTGKRTDRPRLPRRQSLNLIGGVNETETIRGIVRMVAPILAHNPRRLKQFVNLFRLRAHIAYETGLFDTVLGQVVEETLTLEQLGKFVALSQMYPRLLFDLRNDRQLLMKLEYRARKLGLEQASDFTEAVRWWEQQTEVLDLLSYGLDDTSSAKANQYSLERLDVDKLLQVAPYVPRQNPNSENTDIQPPRRTSGVPGGDPQRNDVLVLIDADEEMSKLIGEYFSRTGFKVVLLEYRPTTLLDTLNASPNIVVLGDDSKMDRLEVCRQLRVNAPHIPVLMLTANDEITNKVLSFEAGAVDYITKPFSLRELEARIKVSLNR